MSRYLTVQQFAEISTNVSVYPIVSDALKDLSAYSFDFGQAHEYKDFLITMAKELDYSAVSKTFVMIHDITDELIGYFTLSADIIKLTESERRKANLEGVPFMSLPAIKIGKLAINKALFAQARRKGYGSFAIEIAATKAYEVLEARVACRFLTVDADIGYDPNIPLFYEKNGFVRNEAINARSIKTTISMRKDIFDA